MGIYYVYFQMIAPICGLIIAIIAKLKKRSFLAWFFYGGIIPIIPIVHVIAIKSKKLEEELEEEVDQTFRYDVDQKAAKLHSMLIHDLPMQEIQERAISMYERPLTQDDIDQAKNLFD